MRKNSLDKTICGIDGEGQDTPAGHHIYTYLSAVDEHGQIVSHTRFAEDGLSLLECADMILSIPKNYLPFGFMFSYDVTKIIEDMPLEKRYYLLRPDTRKRRTCPKCEREIATMVDICPKCQIPLKIGAHAQHVPITYRYPDGHYRTLGLGFFNGSLTLADKLVGDPKWSRAVRIHDCFRFFGCSFVEALRSWETGTKEEVERIAEMKGQRGEFEGVEPSKVMSYCQDECRLLAQMMRKLLVAHVDAGIPLTQYFGAGSTASALLRKHGVDLYRGPSQCLECGWKFVEMRRECPRCWPEKKTKVRQLSLKDLSLPLQIAILTAYSGGRFENSIIGFVDVPLVGKDIASAYPYALTFLPCLRCGTWSHLTAPKKLDSHTLALVRYTVHKIPKKVRKTIAWMPLPCRTEEGSIAYGSNFSSWGWWPEVKEALEGWSEYVEIHEAWVYDTACAHNPFGFMPEFFRKRIAWGKDGKGIVIKLGMNATYGKAAQVRGGGDPPFQSWVWAGMTTATTRAMLLQLLRSAKDMWDVYAVATDGLYGALASLPAESPEPRETGTKGLKDPRTGKEKSALGAWETKIEGLEKGGFFVKPGLYWRIGTTLEELRARGIGRKEAFKFMPDIEKSFTNWNRKTWTPQITVESRRFFGAKHSVHMHSECRGDCGKTWPGPPEKGCPSCGKLGKAKTVGSIKLKNGKNAYGLWAVRKAEIAFDPWPKRVREDLGHGRHVRLHIRDLGGAVSKPYLGKTTPEGEEAKEFEEAMLEQPDYLQ